MPLKCEGYDPEAISLLQQCLDIATEAACTATGALPCEELGQRLAIALLEGTQADIGNRIELIDFAPRSLPEFRKRLAN